MTIAATNTATLAMARGMALASGELLAHSRYGKILTPSAMALTLVIPSWPKRRWRAHWRSTACRSAMSVR
ncbi:hypothetical protein N4G58_08245 [Edwardsiella piscicida]|nr:hypothetical protein N4G58_08245 [Edwardsiella piscicida]